MGKKGNVVEGRHEKKGKLVDISEHVYLLKRKGY